MYMLTLSCVLGGKKYSFFGKFGVLCFLETPVLRFALLPYYRRIVGNTGKRGGGRGGQNKMTLKNFGNIALKWRFVNYMRGVYFSR